MQAVTSFRDTINIVSERSYNAGEARTIYNTEVWDVESAGYDACCQL